MRTVQFAVLSIVLLGAARLECAVDVSDLGVPAGMTVTDYETLGGKAFEKRNYARARNCFSAAIRVQPDYWISYYDRAVTYIVQKNWTAALPDLNNTVRLKPAFFEASWVRAEVYWRMGDFQECFRDLDTLEKLAVVVRNPDELIRILNLRAWIRSVSPNATVRNGRLAIVDAERACQLSKWREAWLIDTLAAAYAEAGDFENAVRYQEQTISVLQAQIAEINRKPNKTATEKDRQKRAGKQAKVLQGGQDRLHLYQQHHPYRTQPDSAFGDWPSQPLGL